MALFIYLELSQHSPCFEDRRQLRRPLLSHFIGLPRNVISLRPTTVRKAHGTAIKAIFRIFFSWLEDDAYQSFQRPRLGWRVQNRWIRELEG